MAYVQAIYPIGYGAPAYAAPSIINPALASHSSNILRSFGNLGQVSTYSKSIDTPFSSVRKSDVRISNPGLGYVSPAYGVPAYGAYAAPGHGILAPKAVVGAPGLLGVAYSAAPAVAHTSYHGVGLNYAW